MGYSMEKDNNIENPQQESAEVETINSNNVSKVFAKARKSDKIFQIALIIFCVEIVAFVALGVFYIVIKTFGRCDFNIRGEAAQVYVKNERVNSIKLLSPKFDSNGYVYEVDIYLRVNESGKYNIEFNGISKNFNVEFDTNFEFTESGYKGIIEGGKKIKIISAIIVSSDVRLSSTNMSIEINVTKEV